MRLTFSISMPDQMLTRLDALVWERRKASPIPNITRSGVIQQFVAKCLADSATVAQNKKEKEDA